MTNAFNHLSLSKSQKSSQKLLDKLHRWGLKHRMEVIGKQ
jgi:hypothetical protein